MALRRRLVRKQEEQEEPRKRFQRQSKPVEKEQETDTEEKGAEEDDIPEVFKRKPDEKPEEAVPVPVVRRVVPPPAKDKPVLYHKRQEVLPERVEVSDIEELPVPAKVLEDPKQLEVLLGHAKNAVEDVIVKNVTILKLLERVINVQEDLAVILKHLIGAETAVVYPAKVERIEIAPTVEPAEYKVKKPAKARPEKSAELLEFEKEWKSLTFPQKVAKAKKAGVKWEKHASQARENINLTMAFKKHLGLR